MLCTTDVDALGADSECPLSFALSQLRRLRRRDECQSTMSECNKSIFRMDIKSSQTKGRLGY